MSLKDLIKKLKAWKPKSWQLYAIGGGIVLALIFFSFRSCDLYDKNSELRGKYEVYRAIAKEDMKLAQKTIGEQEKKIKELEQKQITYEENIKKKDGQIEKLNLTTAELEEQRGQLTNKDEIIANLDAQVIAWKEKFSLAQSIIEEKDKIIFNLTSKYNVQYTITVKYKELFEQQQHLNQISELRIKALEKDLRISRFTSKITKMSTLILAGLVVYSVAK